jgi:hypothetical protein
LAQLVSTTLVSAPPPPLSKKACSYISQKMSNVAKMSSAGDASLALWRGWEPKMLSISKPHSCWLHTTLRPWTPKTPDTCSACATWPLWPNTYSHQLTPHSTPTTFAPPLNASLWGCTLHSTITLFFFTIFTIFVVFIPCL